MSTFNLKKFLVENKLTNNSVLLQEEDSTQLIPNDIVWTDEDEDTASQGTFNQYDLSADDLEGYEVEVLGYSPSTGQAYVGSTYGSYGETEFDDVSGVRQMNPSETEYYIEALKKYEPEHFKKMFQPNESKLQQGFDQVDTGMTKHRNLMRIANQLFPEFDGKLANFRLLDKDQVDQVYAKYTEEGLDEGVLEETGTFFKATVKFSDKPGIQYGYTVNGNNEEEARQELAAKLAQVEPGREYEIVKIGRPNQPQAAAGALADIDYDSIEVDGVDTNDYPDFTDAYIAAANFADGTPLTDEELDQLNDEMADEIHDLAYQSLLEGKTKREQELLKEVFKTLK